VAKGAKVKKGGKIRDECQASGLQESWAKPLKLQGVAMVLPCGQCYAVWPVYSRAGLTEHLYVLQHVVSQKPLLTLLLPLAGRMPLSRSSSIAHRSKGVHCVRKLMSVLGSLLGAMDSVLVRYLGQGGLRGILGTYSGTLDSMTACRGGRKRQGMPRVARGTKGRKGGKQ
jgi:hypothetical protein